MSLVMMVQNVFTDIDGKKLTQEYKLPRRKGGGLVGAVKMAVAVFFAAIECLVSCPIIPPLSLFSLSFFCSYILTIS
jgi:hypothetical protein